MPHSVLARAAGVSVLLMATAVMTGCAPHPSSGGSPTSTHHASASTTPRASATPTAPPLAADVLFKITVTATAYDGATAVLVETVKVPVASTDSQAADEAELDTECDSWRTAYPTKQFLVARVTTTVTSGSWNPDNLIAADMAGYPVWTGDQRPFQAYCASALPSIPGSARAVSPVGGGSDPDTAGGWAIYRYGFGVPPEPRAGNTPTATGVVLSDCAVRLGAAAKRSIFAGTWPTTTQTDHGLSCFVGGS